MSKYGRDDETWAQLTEAGLKFLIERARLGKTTSYTELNAVLERRTGIPASTSDGRTNALRWDICCGAGRFNDVEKILIEHEQGCANRRSCSCSSRMPGGLRPAIRLPDQLCCSLPASMTVLSAGSLRTSPSGSVMTRMGTPSAMPSCRRSGSVGMRAVTWAPGVMEMGRPVLARERVSLAARSRSIPLPSIRRWRGVPSRGRCVPVHVVAARLGHVDPSVTLRVYAHIIRTAEASAADVSPRRSQAGRSTSFRPVF